MNVSAASCGLLCSGVQTTSITKMKGLGILRPLQRLTSESNESLNRRFWRGAALRSPTKSGFAFEWLPLAGNGHSDLVHERPMPRDKGRYRWCALLLLVQAAENSER